MEPQKSTNQNSGGTEPREDGLKKIASDLEVGEYSSLTRHLYGNVREVRNTYDDLETLLGDVLNRNSDGLYTQVLDRLGERFISCESFDGIWDARRFQGWSHALCHLFEGYGKKYLEDVSDVSFLSRHHNLEVAAKLVDAAVKGAVATASEGCMDRIISPIFDYNFDNLNGNLQWSFKPESLSDSNFVDLMRSSYLGWRDPEIRPLFLESRTIDDYFVKTLSRGIKAYRRYDGNSAKYVFPVREGAEYSLQLLEKYKSLIPEESMAFFLNAIDEGLGDENKGLQYLRENVELSNAARSVCEGIYVDVDDTLLLRSENGDHLNDALYGDLLRQEALGVRIIIFTGGDPDVKTEQLASLGVSDDFLPVKSKSDYRGKLLELIIDDTPPVNQGLAGISVLEVSDYRPEKDSLKRVGAQWRFCRDDTES